MKLLVLMILVASSSSLALEYGCEILPKDLNSTGTAAVTHYHEAKQALPNSMVKPAHVAISNADNGPPTNVTLEGFYRPIQDDFFQLTPIPFLGVDLSRNHSVIYVCAHADADPSKTHATIYTMWGHRLEPINTGNFLDGLFKPSLVVSPVTVSLVNDGAIRRALLKIFKWIPVLDIGFELLEAAERVIFNFLGDFSGLQVERITITLDSVELAGGIDLNNPDAPPKVKRVIRFTKPDLGDDGGSTPPPTPVAAQIETETGAVHTITAEQAAKPAPSQDAIVNAFHQAYPDNDKPTNGDAGQTPDGAQSATPAATVNP